MKKAIAFKVLMSWGVIAALAIFFIGPPVWAADDGAKLGEAFLKKTPIASYDPNMTMDQAMKIQGEFVKAIGPTFGKVVGYKAGLTNPNVQKAFGVTAPVRGTLMEKMLMKSGAEVPADFGARPLYEGDLILRVKSDKINKAKTPMDALKQIDAAIPFIELPDLAYAKDVKINGPAITAINVAARYGVMGEPIPVKASKEWMDRLKNFKLQIFDDKGTMLIEGQGSALLDHPLNVVLWIRDSLKAEGKKLKKGDLLSLGTITKLTPTAPSTTIRARYVDLDPKGHVEISVKFK
ncbi:MAG: hydratase [Deltaproteobacteria bacterium]|nr:hydratase [Deltaproteobacteria bacterium]